MKFGHQLKISLYPEWTFSYLDYDELKKKLKAQTRSNQWGADDEKDFIESLEKELDKVFDFQSVTSGEIKQRIQHSEKKINDMDIQTATKEDYDEIEEELSMIISDVHDLDKFTQLNYTGFMKIIKKHDKQTKWVLRPSFMVRLNARPFHKENYDALIVNLSRLYEVVRTRGNPVKGDASAGGQQQNFVRSTTKYWVHSENITELKLLILKHLPVLVFNPTKEFEPADSAITSIYFDNENFDLYLGRLEKSEGAEAIRLRWYGGMDNTEIFVERKTHREDWTGEKSVKQRFPIKEKYVNKYLRGKYTLDKKHFEKQGKSEKEVNGLAQLANEVQYRVLTKKLRPVVRTFYNRTAFQLPGDARVRISLDTELSMIREDNFENNPRLRSGDNWRRRDIGIDYPFSRLSDDDIVRFPHAILEVKLQTQYGQEPPEWVQELVQSHLVEAVPKFSKFIHGVATLMDNRQIPLFPFWLPQMDIDIRKPASNFGLQRRIANNTNSLDSEGSNTLSESEVDNLEIVVENNGGEDEDDAEDASEDAPLLPKPASSSQDAHPRVLHFTTLEEYEETLPVGEVPETYNGIKIAFPVRIEPKVFFANERTFLSWLNVSATLGALAIGLLNLGEDDEGTTRAAAMFTIISMLMMFYGLGVYFWRVRKIRRKASGEYDEKYGPTAVCVILLVAVIVNFWSRS